MKCCPSCHAALSHDNSCVTCGYQAATRDGFDVFAPEAVGPDAGYDPLLYRELATLEDGNFWFQARNRLIVAAMKRYCPGLRSFLEVGCGTGQVLHAIAVAFPAARLTGSELFVEGLTFTRQRLPHARLMQMDATRIPFTGEFDAIGAFDVIEHIPDDERVLGEIHRALKPGGTAIITVPQHPWLWSRQDEMAHHVRRYRTGEPEHKLRTAGFKIVYSTSFVTVLLPLLISARRRMRPDEEDALREMRLGRTANAILGALMRFEFLLLRCGMRLQMGGSRLLVATKEQ